MSRVHSIDYLKFGVAIVVVLAHALLLSGEAGPVSYVLGVGIGRAAVPTFAVVSGFLFHRTWSGGRAWTWLGRLLAAYLVWVAVYVPVWWPEQATVGAVLHELVFGPVHLWYVAALFVALLLVLAVLRAVGDALRARRVLVGIALGALVLGAVLQSVHYFTALDLPLNLYRNGILVEFPYAVFGFLLAERVARQGVAALPQSGTLWLALAVLAGLRLAEAGLYLWLHGASYDLPPEFPVLAAGFSVVILLAVLRLELPAPRVNLSFLSVTVYFVHFLVQLACIWAGFGGFAALAVAGVVVPVALALGVIAVQPWVVPRLPRGMGRVMRGTAGWHEADGGTERGRHSGAR